MKTKIMLILIIALYGYALAGCSSDDSSKNDDQTVQQIAQIVENGNWRITYFVDSGENETGDFTGYSFSFNNDGTLIAENGSNTISGTWSVSDSSSSDDDNGADDKDFNIFFNVPTDHNFDDLIDDWDIVSTSNSKIELVDVSGGNGGTDYLTFEKI